MDPHKEFSFHPSYQPNLAIHRMPTPRTSGGWVCVSLAGGAHHSIHIDSGIASGILTSANRAPPLFVASVIHRRSYLQTLELMRSWYAVSFPCPKHPPWLCFDDDVMVLEKESSFLGIVLFDPRGEPPLYFDTRGSPLGVCPVSLIQTVVT